MTLPPESESSSDGPPFADQLDAILERSDRSSPAALFGGVSDDFWFWINTEGYRRSARVRELLPGLPAEELQRRWTNRAGDEALAEGFKIYRRVSSLFERNLDETGTRGDVLDFGCGYGRVVRFFLRDMDHRRLIGADNDAELVDFCRESNRWIRFEHNDAEPPTTFENEQFSLIYAYSVFSHFSETMHLKWLEEFRRIIRPGAVLVLTVRPREFIEYCGRLRASGAETDAPILRKMFPDTDLELSRYDAGEYCYSPYDPSIPDAWWGEACVSPRYVDRVWGRHFAVREIVEAGAGLKQHCVVLQA